MGSKGITKFEEKLVRQLKVDDETDINFLQKIAERRRICEHWMTDRVIN